MKYVIIYKTRHGYYHIKGFTNNPIIPHTVEDGGSICTIELTETHVLDISINKTDLFVLNGFKEM